MPTENKTKLKQTNRPIGETSIKWIRIKKYQKGHTQKTHTSFKRNLQCGLKFLRTLNCWLHTRICISVLRTYFDCEWGKMYFNTSTLLGDHGNVRNSKKLMFNAKYDLQHT